MMVLAWIGKPRGVEMGCCDGFGGSARDDVWLRDEGEKRKFTDLGKTSKTHEFTWYGETDLHDVSRASLDVIAVLRIRKVTFSCARLLPQPGVGRAT